MTGAAQWHVRCPHITGRGADYATASAVSHNNHEVFVSESHVAAGIDAGQLRSWLATAEGQGDTLAVCNACDRVLLLGDGNPTMLHDGEPADGAHDRISAEAEIRADGGGRR